MRKNAVLTAAAALVASAGLLAAAGPASAASGAEPAPRAAYQGECGAGFTVVNSAAVADLGTVYLTYSKADGGSNCVVTKRNATGEAVHMAAYATLADDPDNSVVDEGEFTSYAGPATVVGTTGQCVAWGGEIDGVKYDNPGSNCDKRP